MGGTVYQCIRINDVNRTSGLLQHVAYCNTSGLLLLKWLTATLGIHCNTNGLLQHKGLTATQVVQCNTNGLLQRKCGTQKTQFNNHASSAIFIGIHYGVHCHMLLIWRALLQRTGGRGGGVYFVCDSDEDHLSKSKKQPSTEGGNQTSAELPQTHEEGTFKTHRYLLVFYVVYFLQVILSRHFRST